MRQIIGLAVALSVAAGCSNNQPGTANSAGISGGSGTSGVGVSGAVAGAGSGASGASGAGLPGPMAGCEAADPSITGSAAHAKALELLNNPANPSPCAFTTACHGGSSAKAKLNFMGVADLRMTLVNKMACEAPTIPLIDGRGGQVALGNSWLWIKLTAPAQGTDIIPQAGWPTPGACSQMTPGSYGQRMPFGNDSATFLEADRLAAIRNWICAGAPGP